MRSVLAPADLYSLGVIFYEMLCGKPPFEAATAMELFALHRRAPVPRMAERNPDVQVPEEMEAIARRLLEKDPGDRYPSAGALIEALDAAIGRAAAPRPPIAIPARAPVDAGISAVDAPFQKTHGQRRGWWIAVSVAAAALVAVLVWRSSGTTTSELPAASSARVDAGGPELTASSAGAKPVPPRAPSVAERLHAAAEGNDSAKAVAVFLEIADKERAAFGDRAVQAEAPAVVELAASSGRAADPIFDRLANELGADGLDILYDLAAREQRAHNPLESNGLAPPASAGPRARAILGRPEALARATPAMRVAYELRRAPCHERALLFPRAAKDGDDRALEILTSMQPPACPRKDTCCFPKHRELERAVAEIQARIRR
jgi:serine/threonine-protein kinase